MDRIDHQLLPATKDRRAVLERFQNSERQLERAKESLSDLRYDWLHDSATTLNTMRADLIKMQLGLAQTLKNAAPIQRSDRIEELARVKQPNAAQLDEMEKALEEEWRDLKPLALAAISTLQRVQERRREFDESALHCSFLGKTKDSDQTQVLLVDFWRELGGHLEDQGALEILKDRMREAMSTETGPVREDSVNPRENLIRLAALTAKAVCADRSLNTSATWLGNVYKALNKLCAGTFKAPTIDETIKALLAEAHRVDDLSAYNSEIYLERLEWVKRLRVASLIHYTLRGLTIRNTIETWVESLRAIVAPARVDRSFPFVWCRAARKLVHISEASRDDQEPYLGYARNHKG